MPKKIILAINQYGAQPKYIGFARYTNWGKYFVSKGYDVYIVCSGRIHNSSIDLLAETKNKYIIVEENEIKYVYVKTKGNKNSIFYRLINLISFYFNAKTIIRKLPRPNIILAQSPNPLDCVIGIKYAKKLKIACISDVVDLWPESIVVYKKISKNNPLIKILYSLEKWIYLNSSAIVFSMKGGYKYICDRNLQNRVPIEKVFYNNTGVNLEEFNANRINHQNQTIKPNENFFNVVYVGSVRLVNNLKMLCDAGKILQNKGYTNIFVSIYGAGDQVDELSKYCAMNHIFNVKLYGRIDKDDIPYILSFADLCILCYQNTPLLDYGGSMTKMFEYFASGKPVISNAKMNFSLIEEYGCGVEIGSNNPELLATEIERFYLMPQDLLIQYGNASLRAASDYDTKILSQQLLNVISKYII